MQFSVGYHFCTTISQKKMTTGASNTIVWNEIHHKTESTSNYTGHGYPDELLTV